MLFTISELLCSPGIVSNRCTGIDPPFSCVTSPHLAPDLLNVTGQYHKKPARPHVIHPPLAVEIHVKAGTMTSSSGFYTLTPAIQRNVQRRCAGAGSIETVWSVKAENFSPNSLT